MLISLIPSNFPKIAGCLGIDRTDAVFGLAAVSGLRDLLGHDARLAGQFLLGEYRGNRRLRDDYSLYLRDHGNPCPVLLGALSQDFGKLDDDLPGAASVVLRSAGGQLLYGDVLSRSARRGLAAVAGSGQPLRDHFFNPTQS